MVQILIENKCEACEDTGCQIQDSGPLMGMTRPCPNCATDYKAYVNKYGTDPEENPLLWIEKGQATQKITNKDRNRKYIILPDGSERELIL